jgi:hypothetical protein
VSFEAQSEDAGLCAISESASRKGGIRVRGFPGSKDIYTPSPQSDEALVVGFQYIKVIFQSSGKLR